MWKHDDFEKNQDFRRFCVFKLEPPIAVRILRLKHRVFTCFLKNKTRTPWREALSNRSLQASASHFWEKWAWQSHIGVGLKKKWISVKTEKTLPISKISNRSVWNSISDGFFKPEVPCHLPRFGQIKPYLMAMDPAQTGGTQENGVTLKISMTRDSI